MASLRRLPDSKNWIACFSDANGRRLQRSTGTQVRKAAQNIANEYETIARQRKTEAQIRRTISDLFRSISGAPLPAGTIAEFFAGWVARKKVENAGRTAESYAAVAKTLIEHLRDKASLDLNYLSVADLMGFRDALLARVSSSTANHHLKILRIALNQAKREGLIEKNPAAQLTRVKGIGDEVERRPFTIGELQRILAVADPEWKGMIAFGLYTGQRLSDLARLTWSNIDLVREELRLVTGKTKRRTILPLAKPLLEYVGTLAASDDPKQPLFPRLYARIMGGSRAGALSNEFYGILVSAGLAAPRSNQATGKGRASRRLLSEISFHSLRHTATTLLKAAGVSDAVTREFIGHDSAAVSQEYTHIETATLRKAVRKLPNVFPVSGV